MWSVFVLAWLGVLSLSASASVQYTLDFEDLPVQYLYNYTGGGGQAIGDFYAASHGFHVSTPQVWGYREEGVGGTYHYNSTQFPPHSGTTVIGSGTGNSLEATLDTPASQVDLWGTNPYWDPVLFEAFDSDGHKIGSYSAGYNSYSISQWTIVVATDSISKIKLTGPSYGSFTADDIHVYSAAGGTGGAAPEVPAFALIGAVPVVGGLLRRFRRRPSVT